MKDLIIEIEEKAKRYDEAINKAKSKIKNDEDHVLYEKDIIEIFPELKESEDERIRKWIIENIQETLDIDGFFEGQKTMAKDAIAWLEKQGEQKFVDKCKDCNNVKGCITCIDVDQYAHITEQKPSTFVTEFDTEVERFCKECFITDADEKGKVFCIARHFADWQKNRKNPAWSEEDKENISMLIDLVESKEESMEVKIELSAWLKSIKEKMQPQPKLTWSEEDEVMLGNALWACKEKYCSTETYNWLKSIKDRMAWKPTEEQMESIARATNRCISVGDAQVLLTL